MPVRMNQPAGAPAGAGDQPSADGDGPSAAQKVLDEYAERPELFVGAAFVGGFALAKILKLLGR